MVLKKGRTKKRFIFGQKLENGHFVLKMVKWPFLEKLENCHFWKNWKIAIFWGGGMVNFWSKMDKW